MSRYIAAIDIGTTSAKALLVDATGAVSHPVSVDLDTRQGVHGEVTQEPRAWFDALRFAAATWWAAGVPPEAVELIAPCGQMQNLVALDAAGEPLGDALLYSDRRAVAEAEAIERMFGSAALLARLGNPLDAGSLPPKLLRRRDEAPAASAETAKILLGAKDYVIARLTGNCVSDATTASTTGMYRLFDACWDTELLTALHIDPALLPTLLPASSVAGGVSAGAAAATGFAIGTPVICGLGDAAATAVGAGLVAPEADQGYLYLGTTAWIAVTAPLAAPGDLANLALSSLPPGVVRLAGVEPGQMILIAPVLNGGAVLDWSLRLLGERVGEDRAAHFTRLAAALDASPVSGGPAPLFLPFLTAERCPIATRGVNGTFLRIGTDTTRGELLRAVLDGSALALRWCGELLPMAGHAGVWPVIGGGARFAPWLQTIADALGRPLRPQAAADHLTALGVAALAARRLGWAAPRPATAAAAATPVSATVWPTAEGRARLDAIYPAFRRAAEMIARLDEDAF